MNSVVDAPPGAAADEPLPEGPRPPLALTVDDDRDQRELTRRLLERIGFAVEEAENGAEGLALLAEHPPDLLVLDLEMPVLSGLELLEAAEAKGLLGKTHVVVVSAATHLRVPDYCYRLAKPLSGPTLVTLVRGIAAQRGDAPVFGRDLAVDGARSKSRPAVLVVEDYPPNRQAILALLEAFDVTAIAVASGEEALLAAQSQSFALIVMDYGLPGIDGYTTARRIRALKGFERTPIVFVSGQVTDPVLVASVAGAGVGFLLKPVDGDRFRALAAEFLPVR